MGTAAFSGIFDQMPAFVRKRRPSRLWGEPQPVRLRFLRPGTPDYPLRIGQTLYHVTPVFGFSRLKDCSFVTQHKETVSMFRSQQAMGKGARLRVIPYRVKKLPVLLDVSGTGHPKMRKRLGYVGPRQAANYHLAPAFCASNVRADGWYQRSYEVLLRKPMEFLAAPASARVVQRRRAARRRTSA